MRVVHRLRQLMGELPPPAVSFALVGLMTAASAPRDGTFPSAVRTFSVCMSVA